MKLLQYIKHSTSYNSNHGGKMIYVFFKDTTVSKSYKTVLYEKMRNYNNWKNVLTNAKRGDYIDNLQIKTYKGRAIVNADSQPKLITASQMLEIQNKAYEDYFGIPRY